MLRLQYQSAHAAWRSMTRAITEAMMSGEIPSADLLAREIRAKEHLEVAQRAYREAFSEESPNDGRAA